MATRLNPYLSFRDTARTAMEYYAEVFGGELAVRTFGELGADGPEADLVMHAVLSTPSGFTLMAADTPPGMDHTVGSNITLSLSNVGAEGAEADVSSDVRSDAEELRGYWTRLSEGGTVGVPLEEQVWGDEFGMCVDRFGIGWLVNIAGG